MEILPALVIVGVFGLLLYGTYKGDLIGNSRTFYMAVEPKNTSALTATVNYVTQNDSDGAIYVLNGYTGKAWYQVGVEYLPQSGTTKGIPVFVMYNNSAGYLMNSATNLVNWQVSKSSGVINNNTNVSLSLQINGSYVYETAKYNGVIVTRKFPSFGASYFVGGFNVNRELTGVMVEIPGGIKEKITNQVVFSGLNPTYYYVSGDANNSVINSTVVIFKNN